MSMNDQESAVSIDLEVTNKFYKWTILHIQNPLIIDRACLKTPATPGWG